MELYDADGWTFTCRTCGATTVLVKYECAVSGAYVQTVACTCGKAPNGVASARYMDTATTWRRTGPLDEERRPDWDDEEKVEDLDDEEIGYEVVCQECVEAAGEDDIETEEDAEQAEILNARDNNDRTWTVMCAGCRRGIEFGWSHPDRGGRIWPVECSDFNPWKSWPEPRFEEAWRAKGWIRPIF